MFTCCRFPVSNSTECSGEERSWVREGRKPKLQFCAVSGREWKPREGEIFQGYSVPFLPGYRLTLWRRYRESQRWTWLPISPVGCIPTPCWTDNTQTLTIPAWGTTTWSPRRSSCLRMRWMFSLITWTHKETHTTLTLPGPECPTARRTVRWS